MTALQRFIIRHIPNSFSNKDELASICEEYKKIYGTDLKTDWTNFKEHVKKIMNGE